MAARAIDDSDNDYSRSNVRRIDHSNDDDADAEDAAELCSTKNQVSANTNDASKVSFMGLPLELRRRIYSLTAEANFDIKFQHLEAFMEGDHKVLVLITRLMRTTDATRLRLFKENTRLHLRDLTSISFKSFPNVFNISHAVRMEAFEALLRNNIFNLVDMNTVLPAVENYITSNRLDTTFFHNLTTASLSLNALPNTNDTSYGSASEIFGRCSHLKRLYINPDRDALASRNERVSYSYSDSSHHFVKNDLWHALKFLPALQDVVLRWRTNRPRRIKYWLDIGFNFMSLSVKVYMQKIVRSDDARFLAEDPYLVKQELKAKRLRGSSAMDASDKASNGEGEMLDGVAELFS